MNKSFELQNLTYTKEYFIFSLSLKCLNPIISLITRLCHLTQTVELSLVSVNTNVVFWKKIQLTLHSHLYSIDFRLS